MVDANPTRPRCDVAQVALLIVSYNGMEFLPDCLASIFASPDAPPAPQIVVVDNASGDQSAQFIASTYPQITLLPLPTNTGFTGGNNAGFDFIRKQMPHVRFVALLNQDTIVRSGWLTALLEAAHAPDVASVQAKLLFHPETTLLNSAGNKSHYLGFGFVSAYREPDGPRHDQERDIAFASGAAMLVRVDAIARERLFDPAYFAYLEDAELGWYLRITGRRNVYCPASVVYHRYHFSRNPQLYYRLESNRWRLLLAYYRWPTLVLILPAALMMEAGLLFYFLRAGAMRQKLRSWGVLREMGDILRSRQGVQAQRQISDRELTKAFIASADFAEVRNPLLTYIGNPLLTLYWRLARLFLWW